MLRILKSQFIGNLTLKPYFESIKILASRTSLFKHLYLKEDRLQRLIDKMEAVSGWKSRKKKEGFGTTITECFGTTAFTNTIFDLTGKRIRKLPFSLDAV